MQEVTDSYETTAWAQELLTQWSIGPSNKPGYTLSNGLLWFRGQVMVGDNDQLRNQILQSLHGSPLESHLGIRSTYHKVKQLFYWPKLKKTVTNYVPACDICQHCKHKRLQACYNRWVF